MFFKLNGGECLFIDIDASKQLVTKMEGFQNGLYGAELFSVRLPDNTNLSQLTYLALLLHSTTE